MHPQIALQSIDGLMFVRQDEILYASADGNYTHVYLTNNREAKVLRQLKEVEELLQGESFVRIHRSHLVNLEHIIRLGDEGGESVVLMTNGGNVPVSRDRKAEFIEKFTRI